MASLEANDADLTNTCHGNDCPCARLAFSIESGNTAGLFDIDGSTGLVSAASDLTAYDGQVFKLYVSVVNQGLDIGDVRGPKDYARFTIAIGLSSGQQPQLSDDTHHIRHRRVRLCVVV